MKEFDIPVCNIFKPKIIFDQLCYETNLQNLMDSNSLKIGKQLKVGLTLLLDYNEERQSYNSISKNESLGLEAPYNDDDNSFSVYLNTKGKNIFLTRFFPLS